jgi:hypothetical protein
VFVSGAFPEIQVAQYPLDMGHPSKAGKSNKVLAVTTDATGRINYDAVIRKGHDKGTVIVSQHGALVPKVDLRDEVISMILARLKFPAVHKFLAEA